MKFSVFIPLNNFILNERRWPAPSSQRPWWSIFGSLDLVIICFWPLLHSKISAKDSNQWRKNFQHLRAVIYFARLQLALENVKVMDSVKFWPWVLIEVDFELKTHDHCLIWVKNQNYDIIVAIHVSRQLNFSSNELFTDFWERNI